MQDIVGARAVQAGTSATASGVVAQGYRLVIRLERPVGDFAARTSMPFFCAVPPNLPADQEGRGVFAGSGLYYVTEYRLGERSRSHGTATTAESGRTMSTASAST